MGFTQCKAEQPLQGMELQVKKSTKTLKHQRNLLILDFRPFRSLVKVKHSIGREFQSLAVQGKKLLT